MAELYLVDLTGPYANPMAGLLVPSLSLSVVQYLLDFSVFSGGLSLG